MSKKQLFNKLFPVLYNQYYKDAGRYSKHPCPCLLDPIIIEFLSSHTQTPLILGPSNTIISKKMKLKNKYKRC